MPQCIVKCSKDNVPDDETALCFENAVVNSDPAAQIEHNSAVKDNGLENQKAAGLHNAFDIWEKR